MDAAGSLMAAETCIGCAGPRPRSACCRGSALRASAWPRRSCWSPPATSWLRMTSLPRNRGVARLGTLQRCPQTAYTGAHIYSQRAHTRTVVLF